MKKLNVIINADDLGMSDTVNEAIERAICVGCISSSTIMANAPAFNDVIRIVKQYPQISFGVHLNVDEFTPLSNTDIFRKYNILDDAGQFKKEVLHGFSRIEEDLVSAIYEEWKAQLDKVFAAGIVPSHVDSHEYTHGIIELQNALINLLNEYGIKKVRRKAYTSIPEMIVNRGVGTNTISNDSNSPAPQLTGPQLNNSFFYRRLIQLKDGYKHRLWIQKMRKEGFILTDFFDSYQMFMNAYPKLLKYGCYRTVELMAHPGHHGYQKETEFLMQKKLADVCQYELINYKDLWLR